MLTPDQLDMQLLACHIIATNMEDYTCWNTKGKGNGAQCWHEVVEAGLWLTATHGDCLEDRELWCDIAGACPDWIRKIAIDSQKTHTVYRREDFVKILGVD